MRLEPTFDRLAGNIECLTQDFLRDPSNTPLPATPQGLELLIDALAAKANERTAGAICAISARMPAPEWSVRLLTKASASLAF